MQYEKRAVLSPGQKRLRKAVYLVPVALMGASQITALGLLSVGLDKLPTTVIFAAVALVLLAGFSTFIMLCILAYWMREHRRWQYGSLEIFFALVLLVVTVYQSMRGVPVPQGWSFPLVADLAKYAASLYVMVRGFDNIGQGLKSDPVWGRRWRWFSLQQVDQPNE
ncbi:MAG: hypothetical protein EOQ50_04870 [Mesorhizobium sp.]|uniref:hypothetical protein n=1 Tax=Mesorhizobium sp. TaxID=1871066 RepID=UPI000FE6D1F5|nr:hypothetical protein [Mesorhizobium sp.]RWB79141.1 MAG: hypothetical protein EOQ50_04870 [Mesorhizobium sp.]